MNNVYFVRHAKPDFNIKDELLRPLNKEGISDSKKVTEFLKDKNITKIYSSPYKRSIDTINDFASSVNMDISLIEDFRERKISNEWIEDFNGFAKMQWNDFNYRLEDGESLKEVQDRNIRELHKILNENNNENIVIGTHGTALSTILNYFTPSYVCNDFLRIIDFMPYIIRLDFSGVNLVGKEELLIVKKESNGRK